MHSPAISGFGSMISSVGFARCRRAELRTAATVAVRPVPLIDSPRVALAEHGEFLVFAQILGGRIDARAGVYISINTLCDMGATCVNVIGDMAGCVVLKEKIKLED